MGLTHFDEFAFRLRESMFAQPWNTTARRKSDPVFNQLALELFELQFTHCPPYRTFCAARGAVPGKIGSWVEIPAVPTAAFKELDLSCLPPSSRTAVFHSSGTTEHRPSRHSHNAASLRIYEGSLLPWFQAHFFPESEPSMDLGSAGPCPEASRWDLTILTPPLAQAPHSSLVHMFDVIRRQFGSEESTFVGSVARDGGWTVHIEAILTRLRRATQARKPLALLGTAFTFVHLLDFMVERGLAVQLPPGSRVLETGGYKGRSRALPRAELHSLIAERLSVPRANILSEYGMSELSSQAYGGSIGTPGMMSALPNGSPEAESPAGPAFRFPPWARSQVISPETGREVAEGQTGLLRVFDLANVFSIMAIQTEDLALRRGNGFELIGRATRAEPRGCSLMASATV